MQTSWRIGSLFGIPLLLDPLWFVILAVATLNFGLSYQQWGATLGWSAGIITALLLFGSVLLHELGHSLAARSQGINVKSITLFLFGGIAAIEEESKTPGQAFQVAIAGPTVSVILFVLLSAIAYLLPTGSLSSTLIGDLAKINLVLAIFNLIPGLPLDGGQVLKAAVWKVTGNRFQAVRTAASAGQILGWSAIALGFAIDFMTGELVSGLWIVLLGWFGIRNATAYKNITSLQEALLTLQVSDAMNKDFRVVDADSTLRQFADLFLLAPKATQVYFAASDGRYRGIVSVDDLRLIERSQWETQTLHSIARPLTEIPTVTEATSIADTINQLENQQLQQITVLSPAGAVAGLVDKGDIVRTLAEKLKLRIVDAEIKRVKEEGTYPPGLPLSAIAKAASK
ncbi:site-2 protease family protein [Gloeocapsopsis sp. IPPAS B-1203]|uniref:site-2 protease family protein n=1 Tax=Gloeocapsopsis sp. IPPAS B-1203 TaxID=2049454 RepID=UPI000C19175B|nr:site-2 protease family protein [Gloeocapsopsis sp. IPPAS B-1203]PIG95260.1 site-2 protease family protein [Gloeocapsopsis sp. IPPAS B-1203]